MRRCSYLMLDPLRAIDPCHCSFIAPGYVISYLYRCHYLLSDPLCAIVSFPILQITQIELEPKYCILLGKSLYIQFTPQLFSTVYISNKVR